MHVLEAFARGIGWLAAYGLGGLACAGLLFNAKDKKGLGANAALTFGAAIAVMVVSILYYVLYLKTSNLHASFWGGALVSLLAAAAFRRRLGELLTALTEQKTWRDWLADLVLAVGMITVFALLEQFLPEYDGYIHERMADILVAVGHINVVTTYYRPGFLYLVAMTKLVWPTDSLFYTKFFFPSLFLLLAIRSFRLWTGPKSPWWLAWFAALASPLFVSQVIYFRAQTIVAMMLPLAAYAFLVRPERWLKFLMLVLGLLGVLFFHIFFVFVLMFSLPFLWSEFMRVRDWNVRERALGVAVALLVVANMLPHLANLKVDLSAYLVFTGFHFVANPLFSLTAGGGGLSSLIDLIKYYVDQGLFYMFCVAIVTLVAWRRGTIAEWRISRNLWLATLALFIGAEVLPRIGLKYDPQRFWLFINLTLIMLVTSTVAGMSAFWQRRLTVFLGCMAAVSLLVVGYFVHTRAKTFKIGRAHV